MQWTAQILWLLYSYGVYGNIQYDLSQCSGTDDHMQGENKKSNGPYAGCELPFGGMSMPPFIRGESGASVVAGSVGPSG